MNALTTILSAAATFFGTGIIANWLIQRWQYRNWLNQQMFLGSEKKYEALRAHADEIAKLSASRLSAMSRLVKSLSLGEEAINARLQIYSEALDQWNSNINILFVRTTMYFDYTYTQRLETDINLNFVQIGGLIERAVRNHRDGLKTNDLKIEVVGQLDRLQGIVGNFNRDLLRIVINQRAATYQGVELTYNAQDLTYFSTSQLFKALFISRVKEYRIILTSHQLERPARRRD